MLHLEWLAGYLDHNGFSVEREALEFTGEAAVVAELETKNGMLTVYAVAGGARIGKPNGSHKYYYEVSDAKLANHIRQVIASNGGKKEA